MPIPCFEGTFQQVELFHFCTYLLIKLVVCRPVVSLLVQIAYPGLSAMNVVWNLEGFVQLETTVLLDLPLLYLALGERLAVWTVSSMSALAKFVLQGCIVSMKG